MPGEKVLVIALVGPRRVGKDSTAKIIEEQVRQLGKSVERFAFADAVRRLCSSVLDIPLSVFYDDEQKEKLILGDNGSWSPRQVMISVAENFRMIDKFVWATAGANSGRSRIGMTAEEYERQAQQLMHVDHLMRDQVFIYTDVRYKIEIDALKKVEEFDVVTVGIKRNAAPDSQDTADTEARKIARSCDYLLDNSQDDKDELKHLRTAVALIMGDIKHERGWA